MHILIKNKNLYIGHYKVKCAIGKRGIGIKKKEGDKITPKEGCFKIKYILYRKDRVKKLYTNIKKKVIKKAMGWCDDPRSINYNKLIYFPFKYRARKTLQSNIYDIILFKF